MKLLILSIVALSAFSTAAFAARNNSPHALACMSRNGFTYEQWRSHHGIPIPAVQSYIACRDGVSSARARQIGERNGNFVPR